VAKKTPPFLPYTEWTTAKFFGFIRSGLREKFNRWPPKYNVIRKAGRITNYIDDEGKPVLFKTGKKVGEVRTFKEYQCCECKCWFKQKEVQVDHIIPAGKLNSFDDLGEFAKRLFVGEDGLQVMCYPCHTEKTNREKK
jgi:5-methylcytosine-specific restriction endonuclease McrA